MRPVEIGDADRAAYHAAASMASNFLVTLEGAAERLLATAGADRELLVPLVRGTVENWATLGARERAHGPDRPRRRGDGRSVSARPSPSARPSCSTLFDALAGAARALTRSEVAA